MRSSYEIKNLFIVAKNKGFQDQMQVYCLSKIAGFLSLTLLFGNEPVIFKLQYFGDFDL